jgi:hypothetical protein
MVIHSPIFSGSISQDRNFAYADLSGSFTGSLTGSFKGTIEVQQASFDNLIVNESLVVSGSMQMTGSINLTEGGYLVEGVNVLDTALAYAIALG